MLEDSAEKKIALLQRNPFDARMNYKLLAYEPGKVKMQTVAHREQFENSRQAIHGGFLYALCDTYMGMACFSLGRSVSTMDLNIHYVRPTLPDSVVTGEAEVLHAGRKTMMAVCDFYDENERLLAHCEGSFFVLGPIEEGEK